MIDYDLRFLISRERLSAQVGFKAVVTVAADVTLALRRTCILFQIMSKGSRIDSSCPMLGKLVSLEA